MHDEIIQSHGEIDSEDSSLSEYLYVCIFMNNRYGMTSQVVNPKGPYCKSLNAMSKLVCHIINDSSVAGHSQ